MALPSPIPTRQRIWKALRVQKICDAHILAAAAAAPETSTREYLGLLVRAGYVVVIQHGNGRVGRLTRYQLLNDSGPRAPKRVFDFMQDGNTQQMIALVTRQNNRRAAYRSETVKVQRERFARDEAASAAEAKYQAAERNVA